MFGTKSKCLGQSVVMMIGGFNLYAVQKASEQDEKNFIRTGADLEQTLNAITD